MKTIPDAGIRLEHFWISRALDEVESAALALFSEEPSFGALAEAVEKLVSLRDGHEAAEAAAIAPVAHLFSAEDRGAIHRQHTIGQALLDDLASSIEEALSSESPDTASVAQKASMAARCVRDHFAFEEEAMARASS